MIRIRATLPRFIALGDASGLAEAGAWAVWPPTWFATPFGPDGIVWTEVWRPAS